MENGQELDHSHWGKKRNVLIRREINQYCHFATELKRIQIVQRVRRLPCLALQSAAVLSPLLLKNMRFKDCSCSTCTKPVELIGCFARAIALGCLTSSSSSPSQNSPWIGYNNWSVTDSWRVASLSGHHQLHLSTVCRNSPRTWDGTEIVFVHWSWSIIECLYCNSSLSNCPVR